jgi:gluconate 2-dehydrogenase alpha chain
MSNPLPKADVVIIGLGAAGGMAAYTLTKAGIQVVALEAGPRLSVKDFVPHTDELGGYQFRNWMGAPKVNHEVPTWRLDARSPTQPSPPSSIRMMNAVGGTTTHWGTQSWRFRADDFQIRSTTLAKYGAKAIPAGTALADWPITYDVLEPYYEQVEQLVGVAGKGGANPFESPRKSDYPLPPMRPWAFSDLAAKAMTKLGYHPFPQPAGIASEPFKDRPACSYCGFCSAFGCWNNSKTSALVALVPEAEASGKLEIRPNSRVLQILANDKGQVTGVQYLDDKGQMQEQPAGLVILSSYAYENTRLLLLSASPAFPDGLANKAGQVGKYFLTHSGVAASGFFPGQRLHHGAGTSGQGMCIDDFNGDNFDHTGLGFIRGGVTGVTSSSQLPIAMSRNLPPGTPQWGLAYKQWLEANAGTIGSVSLQLETLPYEANALDLDPRTVDPQGVPVVRVTYNLGDNEHLAGAYFLPKLKEILQQMGAAQTWGTTPVPNPVYSHAYGGTRMGEDPATSVVDKYGLAHEAPNLAVLGASTFPNPSGYNPTITVLAHSWYAADYLAENLTKIAV